MPSDRSIRLLDAAIVTFGAGLVLVGAQGPGARAPLALAIVLGALARVADARDVRWAGRLAWACALGLVVGTCVAELPIDVARWMLVFPLALPVLALAGARRVPFVLGAAIAAVATAFQLRPTPTLVALAFGLVRFGLVPTVEPLRQRASTLGAGVCAGLATAGLVFDLFARSRGDALLMAHLDPLTSAVPRMALEALAVIGAVQLARGRTHGWLLLALSGPALTLTLEDFPSWGGCMRHFHPLVDLRSGDALHVVWGLVALDPGGLAYLGALLAIAPWAAPIVRAVGDRRR